MTTPLKMDVSAVDREDYTHPEKIYPGLVYRDENVKGEEFFKLHPEYRFKFPLDRAILDKEICVSCGWKVSDQVWSSYGSRVRMLYTRRNIGVWEVGSRWLIRDQPNDATLGNDFITQEFLRHQPNLNIPLIKEMRRLSAPTDKVHITLMSRVEGKPLHEVWDTLSPGQKDNYTNQLAEAVKSWRQFTSPVAKTVNGDLPYDSLIGNCWRRTAPTCVRMGRTTEEWLANLESGLRLGLSKMHNSEDPAVIEEKYQELKKGFPKSEPYVLTHLDLNLSNILVKDDKIQAIIDWEYAAYLPWWAERWACFLGGCVTNELLTPLWERVFPEMDEVTFREEVTKKLQPAFDAWGRLRHEPYGPKHPNQRSGWQKPLFCECKPYGGLIQWNAIGNIIEHVQEKDLDSRLYSV